MTKQEFIEKLKAARFSGKRTMTLRQFFEARRAAQAALAAKVKKETPNTK